MTTTTNNSSQVGFLLPVNENLKEGEVKGGEITKITLFEGPNIVGRNCIPVTDKRLSRKHITLDATNDGSAKVFVEGTNPVVIRGKDGRKKIASGETWRIQHGDVIELIPGHYFFKYVAKLTEKGKSIDNNQKRPFNEESNITNGERVYTKKSRTSYEEESNTKIQYSGNGQKIVNSLEGIRNFNVSKENLPSTFRLMRVRELPPWANTNSVSISDIIQGNVVVAILSNYMVDMDWLLSACPKLTKVANALILHGEGDGSLEQMKRKKPGGWILHKPPLPISYGTHHSKAMFLIYPQGVRIVVHTANLISVDWNNKSQGLWMQDFPFKNQNNLTKPCAFETDLIDYLTALKWPEFSVEFPNMGTFKINPSFFKKFDYSNATVRLVASVPGYHSGPYLKKWGHMKLRTILQECTFDKEFRNSPLVYQFSSLGSLDEKWMSELASSMSSGLCEESKTPLGLGKPLIIWPTVENVRCSIEGYAAGGCIPSPQKNVEKDFLKKYWAKWKASHTGRCRAMPHIKTFTRYNGQNIAWFCLTSSNLSKAAWGALQKNNSQLMIRSYELGVLFLPGAVKNGREFSCTENGITLAGRSESRNCEGKRRKLVTLGWQGYKEGDPNEIIHLPVPYELPPKPYTSEDVPWCWDRIYTKKDVYGQVWPR